MLKNLNSNLVNVDRYNTHKDSLRSFLILKNFKRVVTPKRLRTIVHRHLLYVMNQVTSCAARMVLTNHGF